MSLGIYNTLKQLILENISRSRIIDSIKKRKRVRIYYKGDGDEVSGYRNIEPYVFGVSHADNLIVRAWQVNGVTDSESPAYKTFKVSKIVDWKPYPTRFYSEPNKNQKTKSAPKYREDGDDAMKIIYAQVKF